MRKIRVPQDSIEEVDSVDRACPVSGVTNPFANRYALVHLARGKATVIKRYRTREGADTEKSYYQRLHPHIQIYVERLHDA